MGCCSNCGCNNGSCGCGVRCNYIVNIEGDGPTYVFSNQNTLGVGTFDNTTGLNVGFRGVASANAMITVGLDAANKAILLTLDAAAVAAAFPAATTTTPGILETATDAEAIAKAATDKIVTPSNLAALPASTTFAGFVELATNAETQAGASSTLAVTPAGLASVTTAIKQTTNWADSVARAALAPFFEGQFGYQLDSNQAYVGTTTGIGAWNNLFTFGVTNVIPSTSSTTFNFDVGSLITTNAGNFNYISSGFDYNGCSIEIHTNSTLRVTGSIFDLAGVEFQIGGSPTAANTLIATSASPGDLTDLNISGFLSNFNRDTGWTVANLVANRTLDCAAATLGDVRNILGTLISILLPVTPLKPHA